jgi:hypothetical protein
LYAYVGGGVARQPAEVTGLVFRSRHVGLTAAVITAFRLASALWAGDSRVGWEDRRFQAGEGCPPEPLQAALGHMEQTRLWMMEGSVADNITLLAQKWVRPPPARGDTEHIRMQQVTAELVEDEETAADWDAE